MNLTLILLERLLYWEALALSLLPRCKPLRSEESRQRTASKLRGRSQTLEHSEAIRQALLGKPHSEERKQRIREGMARSIADKQRRGVQSRRWKDHNPKKCRRPRLDQG